MRRVRSGLLALAALLGGLAASVALLEGGVLLVLGDQVRFPRHVVGAPFGLRINEPGAVYRHKSPDVEVWFRINGQGMRSDRDFAYQKPPGVLRIVSLGDSYTVGYEVDVAETFSAVLERELRGRGYEVEVLNAGVSGYSTAEACLVLERELFRYAPDLVLVSFSANDLVDNTRTGLFRLEGERLVAAARDYVPAGRLGDFLNRNPFVNFLSERSNAFALAKEVVTALVKRRMVEQNLAHLSGVGGEAGGVAPGLGMERRLAAAIFERIYAASRAQGVPLVIQSIPSPPPPGHDRLVELFPLDQLDVHREGLFFFPAKEVLDPELERSLLYHERSHGHWTPLAHRLAGEGLARGIAERGLLPAPPRPALGLNASSPARAAAARPPPSGAGQP
jgi:lysophospholipase L1-like esterase